MNMKHVFSCTLFICMLGLCVLVILTPTRLTISQTWCSSVYIEIESTEKFRVALSLRNNSRWTDDFQSVVEEDTQVYSAFVEGRSKIRIIGITNDTDAHFNCILWYNSSQVTTRLVKAHVANINEGHNKRATAVYFLCYLCGLDVPDAVSLVYKSSLRNPKNVLPVHAIHEQAKKMFFTMCLSPIHSSFNNSARLFEWIELHKILGVNKFIIYLNNVTREVKKVLEFYRASDEKVHVLPWSLSKNFCDGTKLHYCGQLAALNDCLYRSKGRSHFIAATDLDEFIIPQHQHDITWKDMLLRIPDHTVYLFRNTFIAPNLSNSTKDKQGETLEISNLMRDDFVYRPRDRSKLIAWTDDAVTLGIHYTWALRKGAELIVDPNVALLHHYRETAVKYPRGVTVTRHTCNVTLKYVTDLRRNIAFVRQKMNNFNFRIK